MRKLAVFNSVSIDGYFVDLNGDMSWAHRNADDAEWNENVNGNASSDDGPLVFGRITYEMMASFWPTPMAAEQMPVVAAHMNSRPKIVISRSLSEATWQNTTLLSDGVADAIRRLKNESGPDMTILGSGSIVAQLTEAGLIDSFQMVVLPVVLGGGRTMFDGVSGRPPLRLTACRQFANGNVALTYDLA
ncbi:hypothetical protein AYO38_01860 [bacterium SCGC AG-212-C10]|nr:hypothetical protein AYO38_01860 [bacterium SCGC AG-212-C10]